MLGAPQPSSAITLLKPPLFTQRRGSRLLGSPHPAPSPGPRLMSIAHSDRLPSGYYHDFLDLPIKPFGCATAWLRQAAPRGNRCGRHRRAPLGPAEEVRQWWRRARVRQRKTALVTIPSNQPRMAEMMTIQTSDTVDEPTTQLKLT
jgi:hypothetical protein